MTTTTTNSTTTNSTTNSTTKKTRNTVKISERKESLITAFKQLDENKKLTLASTLALLEVHLTTSSSSDATPPKTLEDGTIVYYCIRSEKYHNLEDMAKTKSGDALGYSTKSQEILTATNRKLKSLQDDIMKAILDKDMALVVSLGGQVAKLEDNKESGSIYK